MERLAPNDAWFLYLENPTVHLHVTGVLVLDPSTATGLAPAARLALGLWFFGSLMIVALIATRTRRFRRLLARAEPADNNITHTKTNGSIRIESTSLD